MDKEINEIAVEINSIFDNLSYEVLNKIPLNIREFFRNNASNTYVFKYDKNKSLREQNIKSKTRGVIAFLYRDYVCNEDEKEEYNKIYFKYLNKKEEEKKDLYNPNNIFQKSNIQKNIEIYNNTDEKKDLKIIKKRTNFIKRVFNGILNFLKGKK